MATITVTSESLKVTATAVIEKIQTERQGMVDHLIDSCLVKMPWWLRLLETIICGPLPKTREEAEIFARKNYRVSYRFAYCYGEAQENKCMTLLRMAETSDEVVITDEDMKALGINSSFNPLQVKGKK